MISGAVRTDMNAKLMADYTEKLNSMDLKSIVNEFLSYLDATDESEGGTTFHPVVISSCRVLWSEPLDMAIAKLRELSRL